MSTNVALLMVQCQIALGLTQKAMGELLGKDRRTIQRWQDRGCILMPDDAETLAKALRPEHPDLADAVLALGHETANILGMAPAVTPEVMEILQTAAEAGGVSAEHPPRGAHGCVRQGRARWLRRQGGRRRDDGEARLDGSLRDTTRIG